MSNLPAHILTDFADQARGLLARVENDLAEIRLAPGEIPAIEAAGRAAGALRSIRTGAMFLDLGELATAAAHVEHRIESVQSSGADMDESVLDMLRAAVESVGLPTAAPGARRTAPEVIPGHEEKPPGSGGIPSATSEPAPSGEVPEPTTEPLRLAERKLPMLGDLLNDLAASHSRLEGLSLGSIAGAFDEARARTIASEGRDLRHIGRFFAIESLEAIGAAVECAAPALRRSDDAARRALPRLRAVLNALIEFTHALGSSSVVRRDLTPTCGALRRIAAGHEHEVANLEVDATWTDVLETDTHSTPHTEVVQTVAAEPALAPPTAEAQTPQVFDVPDIDPVASVDAGRMETSIAPEAERRAGAPDEFLHPLADVMTQTGRVSQMARSIPGEHADPVDTVRAVNRVADDLGRAAMDMKSTVMSSRARPLHLLLTDCATLVANVAGQTGRDLRSNVQGGRLELDDAVLSRLRDPLLAIVHRAAIEASRRPAGNDGRFEHAGLAISADAEGSQVCIRVSSAGAISCCPGDDLDAAREAIEATAGSVDFTSDPSEGAAVIIRLPMNLAFMDAMVVKIGDSMCALPTAQVEEVIMPGAGQIATIGRHRAVQLRRPRCH